MTSHIGRLVTPLVDGQLDHDTRDRAFAHLALCASCQAEVAGQRAMKARLTALGAPAIPRDLADRLLCLGAPTVAVREVRRIVPAGQPDRPGGQAILPATQPYATGRHAARREPAFAGGCRDRPHAVTGFVLSHRAGIRWPPAAATPTRPWRRPARKVAPTRRARVRTTIIGSAAVMLIALGGSAALSDARSPAAPARPATVPVEAVAGTDTGPAGNQWDAPPLATLSVSVVYGR